MAPRSPAAAKARAAVRVMTMRNMASMTSPPMIAPARRPVIPGVMVKLPSSKGGSPVSGRMVVPTNPPMARPKMKKTGLTILAPKSQSMSPPASRKKSGTEPPSGRAWARVRDVGKVLGAIGMFLGIVGMGFLDGYGVQRDEND